MYINDACACVRMPRLKQICICIYYMDRGTHDLSTLNANKKLYAYSHWHTHTYVLYICMDIEVPFNWHQFHTLVHTYVCIYVAASAGQRSAAQPQHKLKKLG